MSVLNFASSLLLVLYLSLVQCSGKVREDSEERQLCQEAESWCGQRGKRQQEEGSDNSEASTAGHTKIFGQICPTVYGIGVYFPKVTKRLSSQPKGDVTLCKCLF